MLAAEQAEKLFDIGARAIGQRPPSIRIHRAPWRAHDPARRIPQACADGPKRCSNSRSQPSRPIRKSPHRRRPPADCAARRPARCHPADSTSAASSASSVANFARFEKRAAAAHHETESRNDRRRARTAAAALRVRTRIAISRKVVLAGIDAIRECARRPCWPRHRWRRRRAPTNRSTGMRTAAARARSKAAAQCRPRHRASRETVFRIRVEAAMILAQIVDRGAGRAQSLAIFLETRPARRNGIHRSID